MSTNKELQISWLLLVAYVISISFLCAIRTVPSTGFETDGINYMMLAQRMFGENFSPPSYGGGIAMPLFIRAVNTLIPSVFTSAKVLSALAGFLYLLASMRVVQKLFDITTSRISLLLLLVNPLVLIYSTTCLSDMMGAAFCMLSLWALSDRTKTWRLILAGVLLGFGWAVRYSNIAFFAMVFVMLLPAATRPSSLGSWRGLALVCLGLLLGMAPQCLVNTLYYGSPFYSQNWRNIAASVYDWDTVMTLTSFSVVLQQDAFYLLFLWVKRFFIQIPIALYHGTFLPAMLAIPGFFLAIKSSKDRGLLGLWGITIVLYCLMIAPVWRIELRYFLPVLPLMMASGVACWRSLFSSKVPLWGGLLVALGVSGAACVENIHEFVQTQAPEYRRAAWFLQKKPKEQDRVLASQLHVPFYSDKEGVLLEHVKDASPQALARFVATRGIHWVVFDERDGLIRHPHLAYLLDTGSQDLLELGWKPVYVVGAKPRVVVWEAPES